jgi:ADP-ribosyl-[dinitrogen reductase] hydrolase
MGLTLTDRARGCAVGAVVGDALGMPLEFYPLQGLDRLTREMRSGRLPAGTFTDDTEMALALAGSVLAARPARLDPADLGRRFAIWLNAGPDDVGRHTRLVVGRIANGIAWEQASSAVQQAYPDSAGNGSVMRCWPVALAHWNDFPALLDESALQSRVTHPHPECEAACQWVNAAIRRLLHGAAPADAVAAALDDASPPDDLRRAVLAAPQRRREQLPNSGWVRHTVESAVWALLSTDSFEEAVVQAANLGEDADTSASVAGALAGAAYGLEAIPRRWRDLLRGEWPLHSRTRWDAASFVALADRLVSG